MTPDINKIEGVDALSRESDARSPPCASRLPGHSLSIHPSTLHHEREALIMRQLAMQSTSHAVPFPHHTLSRAVVFTRSTINLTFFLKPLHSHLNSIVIPFPLVLLFFCLDSNPQNVEELGPVRPCHCGSGREPASRHLGRSVPVGLSGCARRIQQTTTPL
jgi:hypothetical protein